MRNTNIILADEMGLGKTVQARTVLSCTTAWLGSAVPCTLPCAAWRIPLLECVVLSFCVHVHFGARFGMTCFECACDRAGATLRHLRACACCPRQCKPLNATIAYSNCGLQCASLVGFFSEVLHIFGPFLIVVPLSTVPNWIREFRKWIPNVNAVVYVGDTKSREVIREFEFHNKARADRGLKFEALITTYELVLKDSDTLSQIGWNYLIVDEAHRCAILSCAQICACIC